ncbi:hypothetical protein BC628DRAFT_1420024 [Trametes gibbosa]|nr:hypothetical protein BC628DRAFT_1420569 [Trametes gibbosa]KAI0824573.1 hypothetical protein BC628DRAFT_1420024 [Trametes gibbosa]
MPRKSKGKARQKAAPPEDPPEGSEYEDDTPSNPAKQRRRAPSQKQAEIDGDKRLALEKQLQDATKKLKKLRKQAKQMETNNEDHDMAEESEFESEEEDDTIVQQRRHKSSFESRGIFEAPEPVSKRLRRQGEAPDPYASPSSNSVISKATTLSGLTPTVGSVNDTPHASISTDFHPVIGPIGRRLAKWGRITLPLTEHYVPPPHPIPVLLWGRHWQSFIFSWQRSPFGHLW